MISTKNFSQLKKPGALQKHCKAISVLDTLFSLEWESRYHSYYSEWDISEEVCEIRNGEGDHVLILFRPEGCVINGFSTEHEPGNKEDLTAGLPEAFQEFMFGEPVTSIGTSFCLWITDKDAEWQTGNIVDFNDGSEALLNIFNGQEETYITWANEYFEDCYRGQEINKEAVSKIFNGETLTKETVLSIVDDIDDWELLCSDLDEIGYPYSF